MRPSTSFVVQPQIEGREKMRTRQSYRPAHYARMRLRITDGHKYRAAILRSRDREADGDTLERYCTLPVYRGFESHRLRQVILEDKHLSGGMADAAGDGVNQ
jgi:hypothetical protein